MADEEAQSEFRLGMLLELREGIERERKKKENLTFYHPPLINVKKNAPRNSFTFSDPTLRKIVAGQLNLTALKMPDLLLSAQTLR